jgi:putative MATE family efflux protein
MVARAQSNPLLGGPILSTLLRLSLPNMAAMLATAVVAMVEMSYVGLLGTSALAGLTLVFPFAMLQQMLSSSAIGGGAAAAIARALGADDERRARSLGVHAALIGLLAALVMTLLFFALCSHLFALLGGRAEARAEAVAYADVYALAIVGVWMTNTLASIMRGAGSMLIPSLTLFFAAVIQVLVGGALGLGLGPFPRLGMAGVAMGQVVGYSAAALFLLWLLASGRTTLKLRFKGFVPARALFGEIMRVGGLASLSSLQSIATVLTLTWLVAQFGTVALAGYGIGSRLEFLALPIAFAVGVACVPMVGIAIGASDVRRARAVAWTAGLATAAILGAIGVFFAIFPSLWSRLFTNDSAVLEASQLYLEWSGFGYAFYGLGLCLYFAAQGAGKVLGPVLAGTLRLAVVIVGGVWLASWDAPQGSMFIVVATSMIAYGLVTAGFVWTTPWGKSLQDSQRPDQHLRCVLGVAAEAAEVPVNER